MRFFDSHATGFHRPEFLYVANEISVRLLLNGGGLNFPTGEQHIRG